MLDQQYHLYSVDTCDFFSCHERNLYIKSCKYHREQKYVQDKLRVLEKTLKQSGYSDEELKILKAGCFGHANTNHLKDDVLAYLRWEKIHLHKKEKQKTAKEQLCSLLSNKIKQNERTNGTDHIRTLSRRHLNDTNVISAFSSVLSRAIGIGQDELTDAMIIVRIYHFDIFKDLLYYGFVYQGEKYQYFSSSAGQIRQKKAVFLRESVFCRIEKNIMCGLTIDKINAKGGINVNKYLACLALANSASDKWEQFDIDRTIVVEDFETDVNGACDFVDETDYSITRKTGSIPIPHTDGAGMILPSLSSVNFIFRAPWMKGLLGVFDFRKFAEKNNYSPVICDIYGQKHDIIAEDIQIIFTKSQFKMYKYYENWEEYKTYFKNYGCCAGICSMEEERIKNAKINYQMLQTFTDITDEEITLLTKASAEKIKNICSSKETMLELLGVTPYNTKMTPFQEALKLYPALLNDTFAKDVLRDAKNSLLKKYRSGKLEIKGKYTFLLPDFYAACEYWFGHIKMPDGLLDDQEVYCRLLRTHKKLDCLRSPHLYKEHAVRQNTAHESYRERAVKIGEWFTTNGLYASTHDLISKILMYDVDGDKSLVVYDPDFIRIAERNMNGIVPLYYNMRKASPAALNRRSIYEGLCAAFTGGNIGIYSNYIAKIWNDDVFQSGTDEEKRQAVDCVKRLCCQNNFVIDYAKTLYKPEFPKKIKTQIAKYTNALLPAFFEYAKDKDKSQVRKRNGSLVNQIYEKIPDQPIRTRRLTLDMPAYRTMMSDKTAVCAKEVAALYDKLNRTYRYMSVFKENDSPNIGYIVCKIRELFCQTGYCDREITDMLVEYLYGREKRTKQLLWLCYGPQIVANLKQNLKPPKTKFIRCTECGEWIEVAQKARTKRCSRCNAIVQKEKTRLRVQNLRKNTVANHQESQ